MLLKKSCSEVEIQESEHGHGVINHRHRKNKTPLFHVMNTKENCLVSLYHIYIHIVVFTDCCRQVILKVTNS